ncbi:phage tail protein [Methylophaga nitratireducenticrescens]|uniref:phage tail protein n=1 Tax=Methylophaga nitratireducenticrescens TaxID=754476 RepID=UPI000CDC2527|nr:phage tail protein [Methylophaga nitratireducenticrescens]AUZ85780.1 hypothetical protein CDW43_14950 [Methylophaga nitratireducenticrescens]AUZ85836.1 hypothetical protein CDW43_15245 [Methylophaga nitratireducenticrescens]
MDSKNWLKGASLTPPDKPEAPSVGHPTDGDGLSVPPTTPGAFWFYKVSEELNNVIIQAGLTPNDDDLDQFWQAIQSIIAPPPSAPTGSLLIMDGGVVPAGYLKRNGAEISRTAYADLWAHAQSVGVVSQATKDGDPEQYAGQYGDGDGSTTFTLTDWRAEFLMGADDGRGIDVGRVVGSWQSQRTNRPGLDMQTGSTAGDTGTIYANGEAGESRWLTSGRQDGGNRFMRVMLDGSKTQPRNIAPLFLVKF